MSLLDRTEARHAGLDRLKAGLTLLVVLHHTALTYGAIGGWFYRELPSGSTRLLTYFCTINQTYFMGLFFLLAGLFTPPALQRKGAFGFMRDRTLRLGLPLLAFGLLLGLATIALVQTVLRDRAFFEVMLRQWQGGSFEQGPLWFAQALLVMSLATVIWYRIAGGPRPSGQKPFPSNAALLGAALACGTAAVALRLRWPIGTNVWGLQLAYFASYVILYAVGCAASTRGWLDAIPAAQVKRWWHIAWIALPSLLLVGPLTRALHISQPETVSLIAMVAEAFWEPFVAWGVILWLLARAQRAHATSSPLWQDLSRRAYAMYVIHPLPVVAIALAWRSVQAPALLKFAVTGSLACVACYLVAGLLLRLPGVRRVL